MKPLDYLKKTLREKGVERMTDHYKVSVKPHPKYPNLLQFTYNQIESPVGSKACQACRGVILDKDNDWNTVCHSYDRFFNLGEQYASEIDWNTARVTEKVDGTLIQMFHYDNQWMVATKGSPDAGGGVGDFGFTFKDFFWKTWNDLGYDLPDDTSCCYAFELCTQHNRIVVQHGKPRIVFHGMRNLQYDYELVPYTTKSWEIIKQYAFGYTDEIQAVLDSMDGLEQEGFVIVDGSFNRIKMKCDDYVRKHRTISCLSTRNLLDIIRQNEAVEYLVHFPEWQKLHDEIKAKYDALMLDVETTYNQHKGITNQKDYADKAKKNRMSGALFNLRSGKVSSVREYVKDMNIKHLEDILGLRQVKKADEQED
jgi:hypothetical protein